MARRKHHDITTQDGRDARAILVNEYHTNQIIRIGYVSPGDYLLGRRMEQGGGYVLVRTPVDYTRFTHIPRRGELTLTYDQNTEGGVYEILNGRLFFVRQTPQRIDEDGNTIPMAEIERTDLGNLPVAIELNALSDTRTYPNEPAVISFVGGLLRVPIFSGSTPVSQVPYKPINRFILTSVDAAAGARGAPFINGGIGTTAFYVHLLTTGLLDPSNQIFPVVTVGVQDVLEMNIRSGGFQLISDNLVPRVLHGAILDGDHFGDSVIGGAAIENGVLLRSNIDLAVGVMESTQRRIVTADRFHLDILSNFNTSNTWLNVFRSVRGAGASSDGVLAAGYLLSAQNLQYSNESIGGLNLVGLLTSSQYEERSLSARDIATGVTSVGVEQPWATNNWGSVIDNTYRVFAGSGSDFDELFSVLQVTNPPVVRQISRVDNNIDRSKLADGAITEEKLADGTAFNIAGGTSIGEDFFSNKIQRNNKAVVTEAGRSVFRSVPSLDFGMSISWIPVDGDDNQVQALDPGVGAASAYTTYASYWVTLAGLPRGSVPRGIRGKGEYVQFQVTLQYFSGGERVPKWRSYISGFRRDGNPSVVRTFIESNLRQTSRAYAWSGVFRGSGLNLIIPQIVSVEEVFTPYSTANKALAISIFRENTYLDNALPSSGVTSVFGDNPSNNDVLSTTPFFSPFLVDRPYIRVNIIRKGTMSLVDGGRDDALTARLDGFSASAFLNDIPFSEDNEQNKFQLYSSGSTLTGRRSVSVVLGGFASTTTKLDLESQRTFIDVTSLRVANNNPEVTFGDSVTSNIGMISRYGLPLSTTAIPINRVRRGDGVLRAPSDLSNVIGRDISGDRDILLSDSILSDIRRVGEIHLSMYVGVRILFPDMVGSSVDVHGAFTQRRYSFDFTYYLRAGVMTVTRENALLKSVVTSLAT